MTNQTINSPPTIVFLTAIPLEFQAVVAYLNNSQDHRDKGTFYKTGEYVTPAGQHWPVVVRKQGDMGNPDSSQETERVINLFNPHYVFFVGIAGGIKDVELGDVVVAKKVICYERGKATSGGVTIRLDVHHSSPTLQELADKVAGENQWYRKLSSPNEKIPKAIVHTIASGEKVVKNPNFVKEHCEEAIATEMEGFGFLKTIHKHEQVRGIVIRGISDLSDGNKTPKHDIKWQPLAARHAAAFAFAMLDELSLERTSSPSKCKGSLLPYLMNRQRQKRKLISALEKHQANQGPLLCFIHGADDQSSDTCLTRLKEDWIPKDKTGKSDVGVAFYKFDCNVDNLNELPQNIWIDLGGKLLDNEYAKPQEIVEKIAKEPGPVILYTDLYTKNWINCGQQELINAFIKFWADWKSSSAQRQLLLICLVFHYKKDYEQVSWLDHLWRRTPVNQSIRDFFQELEKSDYLNNSSANYVILPELQDISVEETEEWARDCLQECCHLLVPKIRELVFVPATKGKLPMDQLVKKLGPILRELREPCNVRI